MGYEIINLGSDHPHDLLELIRLIEEQAGRKARIEQHPMHAADVMATWANIEQGRAPAGVAARGDVWRKAWPDSAPGTARTETGPRRIDTD